MLLDDEQKESSKGWERRSFIHLHPYHHPSAQLHYLVTGATSGVTSRISPCWCFTRQTTQHPGSVWEKRGCAACGWTVCVNRVTERGLQGPLPAALRPLCHRVWSIIDGKQKNSAIFLLCEPFRKLIPQSWYFRIDCILL